MRVCMLVYSFYESDNRVMRYAETLAKRGDEVEVIALRHRGQQSSEDMNGVRVRRIQDRTINEKSLFSYLFRTTFFFFRSMCAVSWGHLRKPYSLVHVHSVPDFLVFSAWLPRLTGARIILDIHDLLPELYASKFRSGAGSLIFRILRSVERVSAAFADHVIAANHIWHQKLISRSVPARKCSVFLNFPDRSIFRPRGRRRREGKFVFLYPGTLSWHQGLDIAIHAFAKIKDEFPQAEFQIYGEGSKKQSLMALVRDLGLQGRVLFHGSVSLHEIAAVVEKADLGVVAKRKDSFGNEAFSTKILEFMAVGVPVIVSDTFIDRYYFSERTVAFFRSGDPDDLARCMRELIRDPEARQRQIRNAREFVGQNDWDSKKHEYLKLVDTLVSNQRRFDTVEKRNHETARIQLPGEGLPHLNCDISRSRAHQPEDTRQVMTRKGTLNTAERPIPMNLKSSVAICMIVENECAPYDRRVWQEACSMHQAGYRVSIICPLGILNKARRETLEGIDIFRYWCPRATRSFGHLFEYAWALAAQFYLALWIYARTRFRVLQASNPPDTTFLIGLFFKLLGVHFVFDHHDLCPELYLVRYGRRDLLYWLAIFAERLTFRTADISLATNESYREIAIARGHMRPERVFVVQTCSNVQKTDGVAKRPELKEGHQYLVVFVGQMEPQDGADLLLQSIKYIVKQKHREDTLFLLVGCGSELPRLQNLVTQWELNGYVKFTGQIHHPKVGEYLSIADVCVAPDPLNPLNDNSSMIKTFEYMAYGRPIVMYDLKEGRRSAENAALYACPNDPADFAEQILRLLDSESLRRRLGDCGLKRVEQGLNWDNESRKLLEAYEKLMDSAPHRAHQAVADTTSVGCSNARERIVRS